MEHDATTSPIGQLLQDFQRLRQRERQGMLAPADATALLVLRHALTELLAQPVVEAPKVWGLDVANDDEPSSETET